MSETTLGVTISLKEEESVLQILAEVGTHFQLELDEEL
jgi:hypothetical protein